MDEKFNSLIDSRNSDLWKEMSEEHRIELEESEEPVYITSFEDDRICIIVDMEDLNPANFTHELLHIYVKDLGLLIDKDLKEIVDKNKELNQLFSESLKTHLGNCLEHYKMLPLYLNRGFKNKDFVKDYEKKIMDEEELLELRREYYHDGAVKRDAFDKYLGKFFSMKTSNNRHFNYHDLFEGLEQLDSDLYQVLDKFWEGWQEVELADSPDKYRQLLTEFSESLLDWKRDRRVI